MRYLFLIPLVLACFLVSPAIAQDWEYVGDADAHSMEADEAHGRVYFGMEGGIRVYDIADDSWAMHDDPGYVLYFYDIAWRPDDVDHLLSAQYSAFFDGYIGVSEDQGASWDITYSASQRAIMDVEYDPTNYERCFATDWGLGILRSLDDGENWDMVHYHNDPLYDIAVSSTGRVYVGTYTGILRSDDGGESWSDATGDLPIVAPVGFLVPDPYLPDHVYAGLGAHFQIPCEDELGLFETHDGGATWTKILDGRIDELDIHPEQPSILAVKRCHPESGNRLLLSRNGGASWEDLQDDLPPYVGARSLAVSAFDERLYISGNEGTYAMDLLPTGIESAPAALRLSAHPNPFNPATEIRFFLQEAGQATLEVYDLGGKRIVTLLAGTRLSVGEHSLKWDGRGEEGRVLASGAYLCRLASGGTELSSIKLTLIK